MDCATAYTLLAYCHTFIIKNCQPADNDDVLFATVQHTNNVLLILHQVLLSTHSDVYRKPSVGMWQYLIDEVMILL